MVMSKITRHYFKTWLITLALSVVLNCGPLCYFTIYSLCTTGLTANKISLVMSVLVAGLLTIVNIFLKLPLRSRLWIVVCGIYFAIDNFLLALLIITITQFIDDLIITPLYKHYKEAYVIQKEIDKRL